MRTSFKLARIYSHSKVVALVSCRRLISSRAVCNIQYRKRGAEIYPFFGIIVIEIDKPLQHESRYSDNKQEGDALHLGLLAGKGDKVIPQYIQIKKYRAKQPDQSVIKEE